MLFSILSVYLLSLRPKTHFLRSLGKCFRKKTIRTFFLNSTFTTLSNLRLANILYFSCLPNKSLVNVGFAKELLYTGCLQNVCQKFWDVQHVSK